MVAAVFVASTSVGRGWLLVYQPSCQLVAGVEPEPEWSNPVAQFCLRFVAGVKQAPELFVVVKSVIVAIIAAVDSVLTKRSSGQARRRTSTTTNEHDNGRRWSTTTDEHDDSGL